MLHCLSDFREIRIMSPFKKKPLDVDGFRKNRIVEINTWINLVTEFIPTFFVTLKMIWLKFGNRSLYKK
jgi:hypothetical protein